MVSLGCFSFLRPIYKTKEPESFHMEPIPRILPHDRKLMAKVQKSQISLPMKVLKICGDERLFPVKAQKFLGVGLEDPEQIEQEKLWDKRNEDLYREIEKNKKQIEHQRHLDVEQYLRNNRLATVEQKHISLDAFIKPKVLKMLGSEELEELSRRVVTKEMRRNVKPKTLNFFGDAGILTKKQKQILGSYADPIEHNMIPSFESYCI